MSPKSPAKEWSRCSTPASDANTSDEGSCGARRRVSRACDRCRMKKAKCDGARPCKRCREVNSLCTFGEKKENVGRLWPEEYVRMIERTQDRTVAGLYELYRRLCAGQKWEGSPLPVSEENHGNPSLHELLAAIGCLKPSTSSPSSSDGDCKEEIMAPHQREDVLGRIWRDNAFKYPLADQHSQIPKSVTGLDLSRPAQRGNYTTAPFSNSAPGSLSSHSPPIPSYSPVMGNHFLSPVSPTSSLASAAAFNSLYTSLAEVHPYPLAVLAPHMKRGQSEEMGGAFHMDSHLPDSMLYMTEQNGVGSTMALDSVFGPWNDEMDLGTFVNS